jgi:hypothetical protein
MCFRGAASASRLVFFQAQSLLVQATLFKSSELHASSLKLKNDFFVSCK